MTPIQISAHWRQFVLKNCHSVSVPKCKFYTAKNSLIIDCDKIKAAHRTQKPINDYIAFEKDDLFYVGIVEFKGKNPDFKHAMAQLCSGKEIAEQIISDSGIKEKPQTYMFVVSPSASSADTILASLKKQASKTGVIFKTIRCCRSFSSARKPSLTR